MNAPVRAFPLPMKMWSAVGSMSMLSMCVAMLIAAEFLPVSLLTPIAADLKGTQGTAGQVISISGFFALAASLLIPSIGSRFDRRQVLLFLTCLMLASLVLVAEAPTFGVLMAARALLGVAIGGFWALATATIMRLVPTGSVPKALGVLYMGNAVATTFAAPIGSYLGSMIGWRGSFWALVPLVAANLVWQWISLPHMSPEGATPAKKVLGLLKQKHVAFAMLGIVLMYAGAFSTYTYFRPFLETEAHVTVPQLSMLLLCLGVAGFAGTSGATATVGRHLYGLIRWLPIAQAAATVAMLVGSASVWIAALAMIVWGAINAAVPVAWATWLSTEVGNEPESGGGLMVATMQLAIMLGASLGGLLFDQFSIGATFLGGATLLLIANVAVGDGTRLRAQAERRIATCIANRS
jgi:predicted MFS family arabinose efflux permease